MSKKAPGPWVAQRWHGGQYGTHYTMHDAEGNEIADFVRPDAVNVMSAAPEMLEALQFAIDSGLVPEEREFRPDFCQIHAGRLIRAAIAKAKGQQK